MDLVVASTPTRYLLSPPSLLARILELAELRSRDAAVAFHYDYLHRCIP
jgi:hypothetical protein